jgi:hypothetical protein
VSSTTTAEGAWGNPSAFRAPTFRIVIGIAVATGMPAGEVITLVGCERMWPAAGSGVARSIAPDPSSVRILPSMTRPQRCLGFAGCLGSQP